MAAPKLTKREQAAVLAWLCEGCVAAVIIERLQTQFGKEITRQSVDRYRQKWAEEIDEAEAEGLEAAKRAGWGRKTKRIGFICRRLDGIDAMTEYTNEAQLTDLGMGAEYRQWVAELRKELGQETATKHEHSGPGGGAIPVAVNTYDHLSVEQLAAIAAGSAAGAGDTGGEDGGD